jgi:hypothetical protein
MKREGAKAMASKPTAQQRYIGNGRNGSNAAADETFQFELGTQRKRDRTGVLLRTLWRIRLGKDRKDTHSDFDFRHRVSQQLILAARIKGSDIKPTSLSL